MRTESHVRTPALTIIEFLVQYLHYPLLSFSTDTAPTTPAPSRVHFDGTRIEELVESGRNALTSYLLVYVDYV